MFRHWLVAIAAALLLQPASADARGGHGGSHPGTHGTSSHSTSSHHSRSSGTRRTAHRRSRGTAKRDPAQRRAFMRQHPCPSTGRTSGACPGYVVDHIKALKRGGEDRPGNMQWQTAAEGKAKDNRE